MKVILASDRDPAARNIVARLLDLFDFVKNPALPNSYSMGEVLIVVVEGDVTGITALPVEAEEVIVASRHASESGRPTLTVHVPGEPGKLELATASPPTIKRAIKTLEGVRGEIGLDYEVSLEATHHGPTGLKVPITFVEIGSTIEQWCDEKAGEAVARAIMDSVTSPMRCRQAVGLGGPHYAPNHTGVVLRSDVGIGHILPKYIRVDQRLVELAIARTRGGVELLTLDWKGMDVEQRRISKRIASLLNIRAASTHEVLSGKA